MVELINASKKNKKGKDNFALKQVNIKFNKNGLICIYGGPRSGKSSIINVLGGLDKLSEGQLMFNGKNVSEFTRTQLDNYRNTYVSFLFKNNNLFEDKTIAENINLALDLQEKKLRRGEMHKILDAVGLQNIPLKRHVKSLSNIERIRVAIARAIVKNPYMLLADEPTGALDSIGNREIFELLKRLSKTKLVIVATQDEETARKYADRMFTIKDGVIIDDTNVSIINPVVENFGLLKSKLPLKQAIGLSTKSFLFSKGKLILSLIFMILALTCFGVMQSYQDLNVQEEHLKMLNSNQDNTISLVKYENNYDRFLDLKNGLLNKNEVNENKGFLEEEIADIETNTGLTWDKHVQILKNFRTPQINFPHAVKNDIAYYITSLDLNFVETDKSFNIIGRMPYNNGEIVITKFMADQIIKNGVLDSNGNIYKPNSYEKIVNDNIRITIDNLGSYFVSGIKNDDIEYFDYLKNSLYDDVKDELSEFNNLIKYNFNNIYVKPGFFASLNLKTNTLYNKSTKINYKDASFIVDNFGYISGNTEVYTDYGINIINKLEQNQIIISLDIFNKLIEDGYQIRLNEALETNPALNKVTYTEDFIMERKLGDKNVKTNVSNNSFVDSFAGYQIVGVIKDEKVENTILYSEANVKNLIPQNLTTTHLSTNSQERNVLLNMFSLYDNKIVIETRYTNNIIQLSIIKDVLDIIGKYGTIVFSVIGFLMFYSYFKNSIISLNKDILVFKLLGCRNASLNFAFFLESVYFLVLTFILGNLLTQYLIGQFNMYIGLNLNNNVDYLYYGVNEQLLSLGATAVLVLLVNLLEVKRIKNIDILKLIKGS